MSRRQVGILLAACCLVLFLNPVLAKRPLTHGHSQLEVSGVDPSVVTWLPTHPRAPRLVYDVATGSLSELQKTRGFQGGQCLATNLHEPRFVDSRPAPEPGEGYYYQVRTRSSCSDGTYGSETRDLHGMESGLSCAVVDQRRPWHAWGSPEAFAGRCDALSSD